jgi:endonuclease III
MKNEDFYWMPSDSEGLLIASMLTRRTTISSSRKAWKALQGNGLTTFKSLSTISTYALSEILRVSGYPWYNIMCETLQQEIPFNLDTCTLDDLLELNGVGPKIAALFLRESRGLEIPVIDTHVMKFLKEHGYKFSTYQKASDNFIELAKKMEMSVRELDHAIITSRGKA